MDILVIGIALGLSGIVGTTLAMSIAACGGICMLGGGIGAYILDDKRHTPQQSNAKVIDTNTPEANKLKEEFRNGELRPPIAPPPPREKNSGITR